MAGNILNRAKELGIPIVTKIGETGYALTQQGYDFVVSEIASLTASPTSSIPYTGDFVGRIPIAELQSVAFPPNTSIIYRSLSTTDYTMAFPNVTSFTTNILDATHIQLLLTDNVNVGYPWKVFYKDLTLEVTMPTTGDASICVNYPSAVFEGDVSSVVDGQTTSYPRTAPRVLNPDQSVSIPMSIPLDYAPSSDWVGDLVRTSDFTDAFPVRYSNRYSY